jgi:hypothetical protein
MLLSRITGNQDHLIEVDVQFATDRYEGGFSSAGRSVGSNSTDNTCGYIGLQCRIGLFWKIQSLICIFSHKLGSGRELLRAKVTKRTSCLSGHSPDNRILEVH